MVRGKRLHVNVHNIGRMGNVIHSYIQLRLSGNWWNLPELVLDIVQKRSQSVLPGRTIGIRMLLCGRVTTAKPTINQSNFDQVDVLQSTVQNGSIRAYICPYWVYPVLIFFTTVGKLQLLLLIFNSHHHSSFHRLHKLQHNI